MQTKAIYTISILLSYRSHERKGPTTHGNEVKNMPFLDSREEGLLGKDMAAKVSWSAHIG